MSARTGQGSTITSRISGGVLNTQALSSSTMYVDIRWCDQGHMLDVSNVSDVVFDVGKVWAHFNTGSRGVLSGWGRSCSRLCPAMIREEKCWPAALHKRLHRVLLQKIWGHHYDRCQSRCSVTVSSHRRQVYSYWDHLLSTVLMYS